MKIKLSPYKQSNTILLESSYSKNRNALHNAKNKNGINNKPNRSSFTKNEMPIDQRIKLMCTPKLRYAKEAKVFVNHNHSLQLGQRHRDSQMIVKPEPAVQTRRDSLINQALVSDEFFVESMIEFNSFKEIIDQIPAAYKTPNRHASINGPSYSLTQLNATNRRASAPLISGRLKKIKDNNALNHRSSEMIADFSLSAHQDTNDRIMRRFNSVYDSLSDDEDEKNNKNRFEYNEDKYVFDINNSYFLFGWNYLIFIIVIYTTFNSLMELAFNSHKEEFSCPDFILDLIYFSDIFITFFTPFIREEIVIKNFKEISLHYLQAFFAFDIIVGFPFELICTANYDPQSSIFLLKWFRIFRIVKILQKEKDIQFSSRYLHLNISEFKFIVILFIVFIVLIHLASCIWIYLALSTKGPQNWLTVHSPQSESKPDIYIASMYFIVVTVLGVGYGDIYGENNQEVLFTTVLMLLGQLLFSFVLGSLSRLFEILDSENIQIEAKMEQLSQIALKYNISKTLKSNISKSIKQKIRKVNVDYYSFIDSLHNKLKSELILQMHRNHIKELNFFNDKKYDFIVYVLPLMHKSIYNKNEFIFSIGDKINEMYLVTQGCLSLKLGSAYDNIEIGQIRKRNHFGEIQLHFQSQSVYDFKAKVQTEAFLINQKDFMQIKDNFLSEINMMLKESIKIMEVFETRRGLILLLVSYGFSPSMFIPLLRKIEFLVLSEDFDEYYFNNKEMRDVYTYVSKLEEHQIVTLINDTFDDVKIKPSLNAWSNPRNNLINIRTKALIQKMLTFNQGKINENGQYEFEIDHSNSISEDDDKTSKEMRFSVNDSMNDFFNSKLYNQPKIMKIPSELQKGFSELKLTQLKKELSLNKNKGNNDMIKEINDEISSLQQLTNQESKENRNRLPLVQGDISLVRKEAKKKKKFSKESKEKIIKQLKDNMDLLNGIYSMYKMVALKNHYNLD